MYTCACTHTHTQLFNGLWSATTWVGRYQKKHSPTHTHPDHRTSIASCLFSLLARQSFSVSSFCSWTLCSIHHAFFTRSSSCFCSRCPEFVECRCCVTVYGTSTVNFSLCSMYAVCDSRLLEARQNFTATSLSLLRNHRKRQQLTALLKSLRTIKTLVSQLKLNCDRSK